MADAEHPLMAQIRAIAGMDDRKAAAIMRDALLADCLALGAPDGAIDAMRRLIDRTSPLGPGPASRPARSGEGPR